jgi:hypothetical protein
VSASQLRTVPWSALVIVIALLMVGIAPACVFIVAPDTGHCNRYLESQSFTSILDEPPPVPTRISIRWTTAVSISFNDWRMVFRGCYRHIVPSNTSLSTQHLTMVRPSLRDRVKNPTREGVVESHLSKGTKGGAPGTNEKRATGFPAAPSGEILFINSY